MRLEMGLDQPLIVQFGTYVGSVLRGDLGMSITTGRPVAEDLIRVFPATFELATIGILIGVALGRADGRSRRLPAGDVDRPDDPRRRPHRLRGAGLLARRSSALARLLRPARLGRAAPGRIDIFYDGLVPVRTGVLLVDAAIDGRVGRLPRRRSAT